MRHQRRGRRAAPGSSARGGATRALPWRQPVRSDVGENIAAWAQRRLTPSPDPSAGVRGDQRGISCDRRAARRACGVGTLVVLGVRRRRKLTLPRPAVVVAMTAGVFAVLVGGLLSLVLLLIGAEMATLRECLAGANTQVAEKVCQDDFADALQVGSCAELPYARRPRRAATITAGIPTTRNVASAAPRGTGPTTLIRAAPTEPPERSPARPSAGPRCSGSEGFADHAYTTGCRDAPNAGAGEHSDADRAGQYQPAPWAWCIGRHRGQRRQGRHDSQLHGTGCDRSASTKREPGPSA